MSYADQQRNPTKHMVGIGVVIVMHIFLGWALLNGLARRVVEVVKGPIETKIIEEVKPPPPPPPENLPPPPKLPPPPPAFMPPPEIKIETPPPPAPTITVQTEPPPPAPPVTIAPPPAPEPAPAPAPVAAKPAIANIQNCAPRGEDYPPAAIRAVATGLTKIRFTIDATGKVSKVEVVKSAGPSREHRLLDRVAVDKLSTCRFTPGIDQNGKPVGGSFDVEYLWKLE